MSNPDSFIDEVTEEVRREKLYGYLRRYGWIGVVAVLGLVGGAAAIEYRNAQTQAAAQETGDALLAAVRQEEPDARVDAVTSLPEAGAADVVTDFWTAALQQEAGNSAAAAETLGQIITNPEVDQMYRDLAAFKAALLPTGDTDARMMQLEQLARPGEPYRLLALEQIAYLQLEQADMSAAIATLRQIQQDAAVTNALRERVQTLLMALGAPQTAAPAAE